MNPFGFLQNLGKSLAEYFSPALSSVKNIFDTLIPGQKVAAMNSSPAPTINIPTPTPSPALTLPSAETFNQGFANFGAGVPAATQGAEFAKAAGQLPPNIDQLLPAILSLMETGGGQNMAANNNLFNIKGIQNGNSQFINYPDFATALLGGQNGPDTSEGLLGLLLNDPRYQTFRETGNMADFFNNFTPPGPEYGNPTLDELLFRYNDLKSLFPSY